MLAMSVESSPVVAVIGGGPAGLMSAEVLAQAGVPVDVYDAMPSLGRKFLRAGIGGLNITHSESPERFARRYAERQPALQPMLDAFGPGALREWVHELGIETFVGTSGRVFPAGMKAAPLLRAWLHRLRGLGVRTHVRHRWLGWHADGALNFSHTGETLSLRPQAVVLALGGGSWPQLGSDGAWVPWLQARQVSVHALQSANCGFDLPWSEHLRSRFAGTPVKSVAISVAHADGRVERRQGEFVISAYGVEGSLIYAVSAALRQQLQSQGQASLSLDLLPQHDRARVEAELRHPRGSRSMSSHLQSRLGLHGVKTALLFEVLGKDGWSDLARVADTIKALPLSVQAARPLAEAISSAGGVDFGAVNDELMLQACPSVFVAGEMLDWDAPTGGYLLTASMATGRAAGQGALHWLRTRHPDQFGTA
jgi:uncharacterized flavoprotein (TIGR03862 family)